MTKKSNLILQAFIRFIDNFKFGSSSLLGHLVHPPEAVKRQLNENFQSR